MSLKFRFTLADVVMMNEPLNWESFEMRLRYSDDLRGVIREFNNELILHSESYTLLEQLYQNNFYEERVSFKAEFQVDYTTWETLIDAYIVIGRIVLTPTARTAKVTIEDKQFVSRVYTQRTLRVPVTSETTIGGEAITPVEDVLVNQLTIEGDPFAGVITVKEYGEVIDYIIKYLTDNNIEVNNQWYDNLNDYDMETPQKYGIVVPRGGLLVSFQDVWTVMSKLYNLYLCIVDDGISSLKINTEDDQYSETEYNWSMTPITYSVYLDDALVYKSVSVGDDVFDDTEFTRTIELYYYPLPQMIKVIIGRDGIKSTIPRVYDIESLYPGVSNLSLSTKFTYTNAQIAYSVGSDQYGLIQYTITETDNRLIYESTDLQSIYSPVDTDQSNVNQYALRLIENWITGFASISNNEVLKRYKFHGDVYTSAKDVSTRTIRLTSSTDIIYDETNITENTITRLTNNYNPQGSTNEMIYSEVDSAFITSNVNQYVTKYLITWKIKWRYINVAGELSAPRPNYFIGVEYNGLVTIYFLSDLINFVNVEEYTIEDGTLLIQSPGQGAKIFTAVAMETANGSIDNWTFDLEIARNGTTSESYTDITEVGFDRELIVSANPNESRMYKIDLESTLPVNSYMEVWRNPTKKISINAVDGMTKGWPYNLSYNPSKGTMKGTLITNHNNLYPE
jgi:hypothetical protein